MELGRDERFDLVSGCVKLESAAAIDCIMVCRNATLL